ncbi:MAG: enoyl-CoA hydratase/isomerase family protein [Pseudomonadota bacterium]|nr:enoyl-CoA hydratase/isomerase family protein [Pseudomonadota bacterium]
MSASYAAIKVEIADHIATVTLDNPKQRNPFTAEFKQDMLTLCRDMQARDDIDVIIITGRDGVFSAGGVLRSLNNMDGRTTTGDRRRIYQIHEWFQTLLNLEMPVIAAVDGAAYGGGFGLALAADFVLASERARFCSVFGRIGLVPDVGVMATLPRVVGLQKAKELVFSSRPVFADEAQTLGITMATYPAEDLLPAAQALAARLRLASRDAIGAAKVILNQSFNLDAKALLEMEAAAQAVMMGSTYHKNAVRAFLDTQPLPFDWERFDRDEKAAE